MIRNPWTSVLLTAGVISAGSVLQAEEAQHPVVSALESTTISGYVDTSGIWLFEGGGTELPGRSFDGSTKQNGFNFNVFSLVIEKPLDDANWSAGYRAQLLFGPDANSLNSLSTFDMSTTGDFAVKNAYVSLRAPLGNGLDFKAGVFDTVVGYEVFEAGNNPNYSRSYGYYIEPIIHTGVLASYEFTEWLSFNAGIANGVSDRTVLNKINDRAYDADGSMAAGKLSYLGSIALTAPESMGFLAGAMLYGGIVNTGVGDDAGGSDDVVNFYAGLTLPTPWKALSIGAAYDYQSNGIFDDSYANAVAGYVSLQLSEKLKLNGRAEYATGSAGFPETTPGADDEVLGAFGTTTGERAELFGVTGTLDYSLWANAITRLEFRWDNDLSDEGMFIDGTKTSAMSLALNVIYKF